MSTPTSSFTVHSISPRDTLSGYILSLTQQRVYQNELAEIAEQLITLTYDPLNPVDFAQQHAFLRGQMQIYQTLLARSAPSEQELQRLASEYPSQS